MSQMAHCSGTDAPAAEQSHACPVLLSTHQVPSTAAQIDAGNACAGCLG